MESLGLVIIGVLAMIMVFIFESRDRNDHNEKKDDKKDYKKDE